jgi:hypothetical protein
MKKLLTVFLGTFILFTAFHLLAAPDDHWDDQFGPPGIDNGTVYAILKSGTNVYVGGAFGAVGEALSPGIAKFDGTNWSDLAGGVSGGASIVYAITEWNGALYAGGYFTAAGGVPAMSLARWNGSSWSSVGGGISGIVNSLLVYNNNLYVGGNFVAAGSVAATNIARWDGTNWFALGPGLNGTTNTGFAIPTVYSLAFDAIGNLYAGGLFRFAGALQVNNLARWDGTQWNSLSGGAAGGPFPCVNALLSDGANNIYIAGAFRSAGGMNITNLARWDGNQMNSMGGGPSGTNYALAFLGNELYTGGNFTNISGTRIWFVGHWNGSSWEQVTVGRAGEVSSIVNSVAAINGQLYVGGNFVRAGNAGVIGLAKWDGAAWSGLTGRGTKGLYLNPGVVLKTSSRLYIGGNVIVAGGVVCNRIAQFDGTNWDSMLGGVLGNGGSTTTVNAIIENGGNIYIGGYFTNAGGTSANYVAMWDGANFYPLGSGLNNSVNALAFHKGTLFAGGSFTARGDNSAALHGIAMWDGANWQDVPTISYWRINNIFNALVSDGTNLYAGGNYDIGWENPPPDLTGDDLENIGRWDGTNWHSMGVALTNTVNALALQNGILFAGGNFTKTYTGGAPMNRIARWDGSSWAQVGAGFSNSTVTSLAANSNYLYAAGTITNSGSTLFNRIARWDGSAWSGFSSGITNSTAGGTVSGLALNGDDLYLVGGFNRAGNKPSSYIAHWNENVFFGPPPPLLLVNARRPAPGQFAFDVSGVRTGSFSVLASTNLKNWGPVFTGNPSNTTYNESIALPKRFFKVTTP